MAGITVCGTVNCCPDARQHAGISMTSGRAGKALGCVETIQPKIKIQAMGRCSAIRVFASSPPMVEIGCTWQKAGESKMVGNGNNLKTPISAWLLWWYRYITRGLILDSCIPPYQTNRQTNCLSKLIFRHIRFFCQ